MNSKLTFPIIILVLLTHFASGQEFGRNKIQYTKIDWHYIQSEHFDIYYYPGGLQTAKFAAAVAESSYLHLSASFNYSLTDRITIIVYNSHHDFAETNISPEIQPESVGGFTEFFKNRVVIPFEGSLEQFRHVIHHELTHAVTLQFYFGEGPGAIIRGLSRIQLSLWFVEGLAEYQSIGWDTNTDMLVRDAVLNGYLPDIDQLSYFLAYKGGQSVFYFIEQRYGKAKVTELLSTIRGHRSVADGLRKVFGEDIEKFSKKWKRELRKWYWPEVGKRDVPDEIATPLTDHAKNYNFINNSPALSPKGDKLAFLSDHSGLFDIYLISTLDGRVISKLVSGERSVDVEELHWMRPGISWSPDGDRIIFAAKSGDTDMLYIVDIHKNKIVNKIKFDLDGVFSPNWSTDEDEIAFVGMKNGRSDLYCYNLTSSELFQLTDDPFSDLEPTWSPDGKLIAFTSDRGEVVSASQEIDMESHNYRQTDIYILDRTSGDIEQITHSPSNEKFPAWHRGTDTLLFVSDKNGIDNIYIHDRVSDTQHPITNLISGAGQLSISQNSDRLAFVSFYNGGYDIYLWKNPLKNYKISDTLETTEFIRRQQRLASEPQIDRDQLIAAANKRSERKYRHYVFGETFGIDETRELEEKDVELSYDKVRDESGEFKQHKYSPIFSIDYAGAAGGYDPFFGIQGYSQIILSDQLGNHQMAIQANIIRSLKNSDLYWIYSYLPYRVDFSFAVYHLVNFFQTVKTFYDPVNDENFSFISIERFRNFGVGTSVRYPLNRFRRLDFGANWFNVHRENLDFDFLPTEKINTVIMNMGFTSDDAVWAYTGPFLGTRFTIDLNYSPKIGANGLDFKTLTGDLRHYIKIHREYSLGLRLAGGASFGENATRFILGGTSNWINYKFANNIDFDVIRDFYFSQFIFPLRGSNYYEKIGTRFIISNIEFKFPLIQYLITRFPLPLGFANIRGAAFMDLGGAWNGDDFKPFTRKLDGNYYLNDLIAGYGWGIRLNVGFGLLRIDQVWRTNFAGVEPSRYLFSFGVDF